MLQAVERHLRFVDLVLLDEHDALVGKRLDVLLAAYEALGVHIQGEKVEPDSFTIGFVFDKQLYILSCGITESRLAILKVAQDKVSVELAAVFRQSNPLLILKQSALQQLPILVLPPLLASKVGVSVNAVPMLLATLVASIILISICTTRINLCKLTRI
jgi:hypothetical protein